MIGMIEVLSVNGGHDELKFETPQEAKTKVEELIRSSHTVLLETPDGQTHKASAVDETTGDYIVKDHETKVTEERYPITGTRAVKIDTPSGPKHVARIDEATNEYVVESKESVPVERRFPIATVKATALAPSAGG